MRGPGGGYILAVSADEISIAQIIAAAEDKLDATQCSSKANCHNGAPCLTHDLWENLNKTINDYQHIFFIGVAGTGMSAIAQYLAGTGKQISGSDRYFLPGVYNETKEKLESKKPVKKTVKKTVAKPKKTPAKPKKEEASDDERLKQLENKLQDLLKE